MKTLEVGSGTGSIRTWIAKKIKLEVQNIQDDKNSYYISRDNPKYLHISNQAESEIKELKL